MNKRYDVPETSVSIFRIDRNGEEQDHQDCVTGIELNERGTLRLDLRNMRPLPVADRNDLLITLDVADVLTAIADALRANIK